MRSGGLDMALTKYKLGGLIEPCDTRNYDGKYTLDDIRGISTGKQFIDTKANMDGVSLSSYKVVDSQEFAYVADTSRRGEKIAIAFNSTEKAIIISSIYTVFRISRKEILNDDYLFMYFNRPEFDRYSRFNSWGSARETFDWDTLCDMDIELPDLPTQQKYVDIYKAMVVNQQSYERGLEDLKLTFDALIDNIKHNSTYKPIVELLNEVDERNVNGEIKEVHGINITKQFMPSVADINGIDLKKYKLVQKNQFAFSGMQTGRDRCIRITLNKNDEPVNIAIELCLYCMKTQIFNDGNKRASVIFANHFLISKGVGLLVIPESKVSEFKKILVAYYEDRDNGEILEFMKKYCWKNF